MFHVNDDTIPILLFIRLDGQGAGSGLGDSPFNKVDITNFSTKSNADYTIQRSASGGFIYNVFGNSAVFVTLDGIQAAVTGATKEGDIESYYTLHNISADNKNRARIRITALQTIPRIDIDKDGKQTVKREQGPAEATEYVGYLVGFHKKPMGAEKIAGYGFQLTLICSIADKQLGGQS
jgi:hypothetical protein